jgi:hypothetical protein
MPTLTIRRHGFPIPLLGVVAFLHVRRSRRRVSTRCSASRRPRLSLLGPIPIRIGN